ncbi:EutN/CcmL family microcompartment protein [Opitutia bacterium KCR 482]|nr:EutN/CcmL family microcompartment protein [Opitutae bacterium KCR 482]MDY5582978.1 EutN/CcmL family microcompartment protein [Candidatus Merdousia sp.]
MKLARVIGRVVLSKKDANLPSGFLLLASPLDRSQMSGADSSELSKRTKNLVVFDSFGAVRGDVIGYVEGAEATAPFETPACVDAYNVGIVETLNYNPNL